MVGCCLLLAASAHLAVSSSYNQRKNILGTFRTTRAEECDLKITSERKDKNIQSDQPALKRRSLNHTSTMFHVSRLCCCSLHNAKRIIGDYLCSNFT